MGAEQLHGVTETLSQTAGTAGTVTGNMVGHQTTLRGLVETMRGQWEGTTRPAFETAYAGWEDGVTRLVTALTELGDNTRTSGVIYEGADQGATAGFNGLQGGAPFGGATRA
ncbi:WXG100 family type VII secretion target [Solwaraspora sp. WMMD1047]|uniref:WXG100 family type VII secretion target n=1 Tax=Solwaraspora sp. WMMD1047 TaxID=3016102 RepID=UPI002416E075|nr:WXG100 family type VII secretion target [Solwaraspora sp. WMMD1047]MDG4831845.1 WXG100 family type VII secretion target [Solwaraspora sp. WMMD1047]